MEDNLLDIPVIRNEHSGKFEVDLNSLLLECPKEFEKIVSFPERTISQVREKFSTLVGNNDIFFINAPKFLHQNISSLRSKNMNCLIKVSGIIKRINQPTSKIDKVTFECPSCGSIIGVHQIDIKIKEPSRCSCGRKGGFAKLTEDLIDIQEMELEENPEEVGSKQPQRIRLYLENGLTDPLMDKFQVGNKVEILGIHKRVPSYLSGKEGDRSMLEYMIKVFEISSKEGFEEDLILEDKELEKINEIAKGNPLQTLADNIAPEIFGLDHIKKSAVLFLARGVTKNTNGKRYRENIHILIIGDAGTAKSSIIQSISKKAMGCRMVEGKNASRAGIVATVSQDKDKKWQAEAGDIVLANNGYLFIDEADKLPKEDMDAIHGPMESGKVLVSKAGIKINLNANTSVFAAANPKTSRFNPGHPLIDQIPFSSTLLSRFDLIFVLKDVPDSEIDKMRAEQMLDTHEGNLHDNFSNDFIKKYFRYISKITPKLTKEASEKIKSIYTSVRELSQKEGKWVGAPITARHLEGLVRLSEAHAKLRLSKTVDLVDVEVAERLFKHSLSEFGIDLEAGVLDLSGLSTKVKSSKKEKYYRVLQILKQKSSDFNNFFERKMIMPILQRQTNMTYGELEEMLEILRKEGELFEPKINIFSLVKPD